MTIDTPEGHARVAVKVAALGRDRWRYNNYAAKNLDFSRARTEGAEPNPRVTGNADFNAFTIIARLSTFTGLQFRDGDLYPANDWPGSVRGSSISWSAAAGINALNRGTLFRFSFVSNRGAATPPQWVDGATPGGPDKGRARTRQPGASTYGNPDVGLPYNSGMPARHALPQSAWMLAVGPVARILHMRAGGLKPITMTISGGRNNDSH